MSSVNPPVEKIIEKLPATLPEIRIYSHSSILYWWPVWVIGYIMAAITFTEGSRAVIVPRHHDATAHEITIPIPANGKIGDRTAASKNLGVVFTMVLLMVVFITNTPLRGLWSAVAILLVAVMTVTFAWLGIWAKVLHHLGQISIHMNMGFYMFFSTLLFLLWAIVVFGFDRMHYWKFHAGQLTNEFVFGGGQQSYDTSGMAFEKLRDDPLRHWVLGGGSGDLVIKTSGAERAEFQIHNVLFLDRRLRQLQAMISERPVQ